MRNLVTFRLKPANALRTVAPLIALSMLCAGASKETALDLDELVRDLASTGKGAKQLKNAEAIVADLTPRLKERDVVLVMSNGGFDGIHQKLLDALANG